MISFGRFTNLNAKLDLPLKTLIFLRKHKTPPNDFGRFNVGVHGYQP